MRFLTIYLNYTNLSFLKSGKIGLGYTYLNDDYNIKVIVPLNSVTVGEDGSVKLLSRDVKDDIY